MRLSAVKWGQYKLKDLFNHIEQGRRLKKGDQKPGSIPFVMSGTTNRGVVGYISNPVALFPANSITVDIFGNAFHRNYVFGAGDDTGVYWSDLVTYSEASLLFIAASIHKSLTGKYDFGHKLRSSQSYDFQIQLPEKSKGVIDFEFIDNFVRTLKEARLNELEKTRTRKINAYLMATGLNNYELTTSEQTTLNNFKNVKWERYSLGKLFDIQNTLSFNTNRLKDGNEYDYVTRTSYNQGILRTTGFINQENINPAGTWSLGLLQMDFFYRNKPWYAGQFVRKIVPKIEISEKAKLFFQTLLNRQKSTLLQVLVRDVDETFRNIEVQLPQTKDGEIDFEYIELLVAAVQKIVIADVAKITARNLEATQQVIEAQDEPQVEQTIIPLIHPEYKPGFIPLYTIRAACGYFGEGRLPEEEGWIDASGLGFTPDSKRHFAVHAKGDSMLPKIKDGDICIFEWYNAGSRNGEIVLSQISEYDDAYDGRYTIKRYHSEKTVTNEGWQHSKVELQPLNPDFEPIELSEDDDVRTIGIFKCVL